MSKDLNLALRLTADASRLLGGLAKGEGGLRKFGSAAKREMDAFRHAAGSVEGKLAQLGLGISAIAVGVQAAKLDKGLIQLKLAAGATGDEMDHLRATLLDANTATGQSVESLKGGVDALIAAGASLPEATAAVLPLGEAMAVTGASADQLAAGLGALNAHYGLNLSSTAEITAGLERMIVAGRAGNAEIENLPSVFARVAPSAKQAGLAVEQTLGLVEALSLSENNPERVATLAADMLKVFTNANYMKGAQKGTGIKFFDADGSRRDAIQVIGDIKSKYSTLATDAQRFRFMSAAFGKTDQGTQTALKLLLEGDNLDRLDEITADVTNSGGTLARDLNEALGNAVDQSNRLKGTLREAADGFAKPINNAVSEAIKFGLDSKEKGGLGLSGTDILTGGVLGVAGIFGAARYGGKAIKGLAGQFGSTAAGVATGKALEEVAGVQPVFVVNMPGDIGGTMGVPEKVAGAAGELFNPKTFSKIKTTMALLGGTSLSALPSLGAGAMALSAGAVTAAGAVGYGAGTLLNMGIDKAISWGTDGQQASLGSWLYDAIHGSGESQATKPAEVGGTISVHVTSDGAAKVTQLRSDNNVELSVYTGRTGAGR